MHDWFLIDALWPQDSVEQIANQIGSHDSFSEILDNLDGTIFFPSSSNATTSRALIHQYSRNQSTLRISIRQIIGSHSSLCVDSSSCLIWRRLSILSLSGSRRGMSLFSSVRVQTDSHETLFRFFGRTPRDIREWTQPSDFLYAIY